ncbi:MAG: hypothetical protein HOP28_07445 [Gemmatimonadales bacterium]|nr:hypothetical protein [Gemmatimonadales bacterium]
MNTMPVTVSAPRKKRIFMCFGHFMEDCPADARLRAMETARHIGKRLKMLGVDAIYAGTVGTPASEAARAFLGANGPAGSQLLTYLPVHFGDPGTSTQTYDQIYESIKGGRTQVLDAWPEGRRERMVRTCSALILLAGSRGCDHNVRIARQYGRPIIPLPQFGGVARREFVRIVEDAERTCGPMIAASLAAVGDYALDPEPLAAVAVDTAMRMTEAGVGSPSVFVAMPFAPDYRDGPRVERAISEAVEAELGWKVVLGRDIEMGVNQPLILLIQQAIRRATIVIGDLTLGRPNVYFEVGLSHGFERPTIFLSKQHTIVAFNLYGFERIVWRNIKDLGAQLSRKLIAINNEL